LRSNRPPQRSIGSRLRAKSARALAAEHSCRSPAADIAPRHRLDTRLEPLANGGRLARCRAERRSGLFALQHRASIRDRRKWRVDRPGSAGNPSPRRRAAGVAFRATSADRGDSQHACSSSSCSGSGRQRAHRLDGQSKVALKDQRALGARTNRMSTNGTERMSAIFSGIAALRR
jgi:hypothetical protein